MASGGWPAVAEADIKKKAMLVKIKVKFLY
jgi:hypothetical protein